MTSVESGEDALIALESMAVDLILMDVNMPGMDDLETTARIRDRKLVTTRTPIVAMTARAMDGDRQLCLDAGMDDYIRKPIGTGVLQGMLDRWLPVGQELQASSP